jgi:ATP-dependent exoDNAse (exonuclease V) alpha subunit
LILNSYDGETIYVYQYPLKLGWALTTHAVQGLGIEQLKIDCSNFFAEHQLYVALSRGVTSSKIRLINMNG